MRSVDIESNPKLFDKIDSQAIKTKQELSIKSILLIDNEKKADSAHTLPENGLCVCVSM